MSSRPRFGRGNASKNGTGHVNVCPRTSNIARVLKEEGSSKGNRVGRETRWMHITGRGGNRGEFKDFFVSSAKGEKEESKKTRGAIREGTRNPSDLNPDQSG